MKLLATTLLVTMATACAQSESGHTASGDAAAATPAATTAGALAAELGANPWAFSYSTAALGGSWTRWWRFGANEQADNFTTTTETWVYLDGVESYPVERSGGSFEVADHEVTLTLASGTVDRFQAAIFDHAPGLYTADPAQLLDQGRQLATRAFLPGAAGSWVETHSTTPATGAGALSSRTTVTVTPPLDAQHAESPCTLEVKVEVEVDGIAGAEILTPPCTRLSDPTTGWMAAGYLEKTIYRYNHLQDAGVFERHLPAVADAIYRGFVMTLAIHASQPGVAIHPTSSEEALGWYQARTEEPPEPSAPSGATD